MHFPIDILISAAVAVGGGQLARLATPIITVSVLPVVEDLYEDDPGSCASAIRLGAAKGATSQVELRDV